MKFNSRCEAEDICFNVVTTLADIQEEISREETVKVDDSYKYYCDFATRIAKAVAKKMLDGYFYVKDEDTVEELWIDTTVDETNKMLESISILGYSFEVKDDIYIIIRTEDGREIEFNNVDDPEYAVKFVIAEDLLRMATGRTYKRKYVFTAEEQAEREEIEITRNIIYDIADSVGDEISYKEIRSVYENKEVSSDIVKICRETIKAYE